MVAGGVKSSPWLRVDSGCVKCPMTFTDPILASEVDTVGEDACTGVAAVIFEADVSEIATMAAAGKGNNGVRSYQCTKMSMKWLLEATGVAALLSRSRGCGLRMATTDDVDGGSCSSSKISITWADRLCFLD